MNMKTLEKCSLPNKNKIKLSDGGERTRHKYRILNMVAIDKFSPFK